MVLHRSRTLTRAIGGGARSGEAAVLGSDELVAGRYALIIANATYRDPKLSRLRTPARDAEELASVLRDPEIGDFEVELSLDEPERALRRRIAAFFAWCQRDDLLLMHFSCHGLKDDSGGLYVAATDIDRRSGGRSAGRAARRLAGRGARCRRRCARRVPAGRRTARAVPRRRWLGPAGWVTLALLAVVVLGVGTAIGGRLTGRGREIAARMVVAAPAAGILAVAAALLMLAWLVHTQGAEPGAGLVLTGVCGAGLSVASTVSLERRLRAAAHS